jgi:uncharacterized protein (DUF362 family)
MDKALVSAVRVDRYDPAQLRKGLLRGLELLGDLGNFLRPRTKVFVKFNHLSPASAPEEAINTHPLFTREVLLFLKDFDLDISAGDDVQGEREESFLLSGYRDACAGLGVRLLNLKEEGFREAVCRGGSKDGMLISAAVLDADVIINLPKLKTHALTLFTGAVKNMYGVIPCGMRLRYHNEFSLNADFSRLLVDIYSCVTPRLTIMDAITAMEGQGPSAGTPRHAGLILAGRDGVAVDAVAARIVNIEEGAVLTTRFAAERGLGAGRLTDIGLVGENLEDIRVRGFKLPARTTMLLGRKVPSFIYKSVQNQLLLIPKIREEKCTACGECGAICPVEAIRIESGAARIDAGRCINCLCCNEVCRFKAVRLARKPAGRMILAVGRLLKKWG